MWEIETTTLEQLYSSISFVIKLQDTKDNTSLVLKSFSRRLTKDFISDIESDLREKLIKHSLLSSYMLEVSRTKFFVFEGLHQLSRQHAKHCLIPFLDSVKTAIDELHQCGMAHLDIRLPNICFKKEGTNYTAVLIDLEYCKPGITNRWNGPSSSCMYRNVYSLRLIICKCIGWHSGYCHVLLILTIITWTK